MMDGRHPEDLELLAYVDDELPGDRRRALAEHLDACKACAETVSKLEAGRDALRAAPLMKLPPTMRERMSMTLDRFGPERRQPVRRTYVSPMRLVTILAPVAIVVALIVTIADLTGNGGSEREAGGDAAAQAEREEGAERGGATPTETRAAPESTEDEAAPASGATALAAVSRVAGPPRAIAAALRRRGLDASVEGPRLVVVRGATDADVRAALAGRPAGRVRVALTP
jgi:putative zinc finger protein